MSDIRQTSALAGGQRRRPVPSGTYVSWSTAAWINDHLDDVYAGLTETPVAAEASHRFFAAPRGALADGASR